MRSLDRRTSIAPRIRRISTLLFLLLSVPIGAGSLLGQNVTLTGTVRDATTGQGIAGASIEILGDPSPPAVGTNAEGAFRISVPAGTYDLVVSRLQYEPARFENVSVGSEGITTHDVDIRPRAIAVAGIQVVGRGRSETLADASAMGHVVDLPDISAGPSASPADHLREVPAMDIVETGVGGRYVTARDFGNLFSGSAHIITDHRVIKVPSLNANLPHLMSATDLDLERIEVALGPGAALYGPNTTGSIIHYVTKSPLDWQGTSVVLAAGERSLFEAAVRSGFLIGEDLGIKLSSGYFRAEEWPRLDPEEQAARAEADSDPVRCRADRVGRGLEEGIAGLACDRLGIRDEDIERWSVEARADWQFSDDGTFVATYGRTDSSGLELTGLGAAQTYNWIYEFYQARVEKGGFFGQTYYNTSDAGDSYLLNDGTPLVDESTLFAAQARQQLDLWNGREEITFGTDYFATRPSSNGTIYGTFENDDDLDEWGAYLQSRTELTDRLDLVLAGRTDWHSALDDIVFSPRAALVFRPNERHGLRIAYNRAYSSPSSLNLYLDVASGFAPEPLGSLGYTARAVGSGRNGWSLRDPDGTLQVLRSPFNPSGGGAPLPADPAALWPLAVGALQAGGQIDAETAGLLQSLSPSASDIALMLLDPSTQSVTPATATTLDPVASIVESPVETLEVGWTGDLLDEQLRVSAAVYRTTRNDFVSPLILETPLVLLNGEDVGAFVSGPLGNAIVQKLVAEGADPQTAQEAATGQIAALAEGIGSLPVAVTSTNDIDPEGADLLLTFRNVGDVELWGTDLWVEADLTHRWTLSGAYSYVSDDWFEFDDRAPIALNAPRHKGSLGLRYRNLTRGLDVGTRARFTNEFPAESAGYVGTQCVTGETGGIFDEPCVDSSVVLDLNVGYQIPGSSAAVQLGVTNLLNAGYRSFVGVPTIGRLVTFRVKYDL